MTVLLVCLTYAFVIAGAEAEYHRWFWTAVSLYVGAFLGLLAVTGTVLLG